MSSLCRARMLMMCASPNTLQINTLLTQVWAIIVCHFCHNFGTFILLTWMPSYYNQVSALPCCCASNDHLMQFTAAAVFNSLVLFFQKQFSSICSAHS